VRSLGATALVTLGCLARAVCMPERNSPLKGCAPGAEIGVVLTGLGLVFSFLGVLFFFDRGLIALGNVRRPRPPGMQRPSPLSANTLQPS
jgi:hypothetical protein